MADFLRKRLRDFLISNMRIKNKNIIFFLKAAKYFEYFFRSYFSLNHDIQIANFKARSMMLNNKWWQQSGRTKHSERKFKKFPNVNFVKIYLVEIMTKVKIGL